jgi:hypothetical protein
MDTPTRRTPGALIPALAVVAAGLGLAPGTARADLQQLQWAAEGYYRSRAVYLTNLAPQDRYSLIYPPSGEEIVIPEIRTTSYVVQRLRVMPQVRYGDLAKLTVQVDALNDVLWGDNNAVSAAPLFATDTSNQYFLGGEEQASIQVTRAWLEFNAGVGVMRVGRMPSHWGMGLLANGGGTAHLDPDPARPPEIPARRSLDHFFDDDFGDNHFGSTADRILFLTKPLSVYKTIRKRDDTTSPLVLGYGYSVITEAPLLAAEPFDARFRPFGQQGFISRGGRDDVDEHILLAVWNDPYWQPGGRLARDTDELRVGFYGVLRRSKRGSTFPSALDPMDSCGTFEGEAVPCIDTGSKVWIADLWYRFRYGPFYSEAEALKIGGTTFGGVPFPFKNVKKRADIDGAVARFGFVSRDPRTDPLRALLGAETYERDLWELELELGHASGDDELEDEDFTQRALHPDFNVGLILFEEVLRELSARTYGPPFFSQENPEGARGLFSNGGVINANYVFPKARYHLPVGGDTRLVAGVLMAWVDKLARTGTAMFYADEVKSSYLGTELDVALKARFHQHMDLSIEGGYLWYGPALRSALPNADHSFTLQSRLAFVW